MSGPPVSRRTAVRWAGLASVVGGAALGGCDLDPRSSPAPAATPTPDHDERILLAARAELKGLVARLRAAIAKPSQAGPDALLVALERAHVTQLAALDGKPRATSGRVRPLARGSRLVARERVAVARFTDWAQRADSGDLARVLAATAGGISTYLAVEGER